MKSIKFKLVVLIALLIAIGLVAAQCGGTPTPSTAEEPAKEEAVQEEPAKEEPAEEEAVAEEPAAEEPAPSGEGTPYKIGFVAAITGPGSGLGVPERNTAEMMAKQLAEAGGVVGSDGVTHPVEVIILDSESNPDGAASAVSRLISEEEVDVLVSGTLSGNSMAMVPLATEAEVPMISMASALAIVADPETGEARKWIFKTPQENIHSAFWQADYLKAQGVNKVCYLYENSGYGQDTLASGEQAFGEAGIEIVYSDTFERSDTEFPQIPSVQGAGCEAVVIGSIPPGASLAAAAITDAMPDMPVIQGHGVCNQQFIDLAPDAVEGTPLPCGRLLVADNLPDADPQKELLLNYINDYTAFTGGEPISTFGGHAYDAMLWATEALSSLEEGMSLADRRGAVRDYVESEIKDWPGTGGIFNITPDDHLGLEYTGLTFVKVQDGTYVYFPPEEWGGTIVEEAAPAEKEATSEGTPYKIGFVAAITGPGSGLGVPERNTAEMMAKQLAEAGGVVGPDGAAHPVEVVILDSESNPDGAASAVSRLISEEEVDVLVAGTLSGNSMAMVPLATEAEVPMISMASARAIVADPETGEARQWIFKTPQENIHSALWQADYLKAQGVGTVCYLYENSGYGQDTLASGEQAFGEAGIEIVYSDTFERSDTEFPQIVSVQGAGCEAVVIGSIPPGASLAAAAVKDAIPDMPVIQGHGVCNQQFIDLAPDAVEGTPLPCGRLLVADNLPDADPQKELLLNYINDYTAFTGGEPISTFGGHAYDAMLWATEALASLEEGMSLADRRGAIRDYVESEIQGWPGTGGIFNITPDDHLGLEYTGLTFVKVQGGTYVYFPPEEW